jgi:Tfp pilus assembly protein PilV
MKARIDGQTDSGISLVEVMVAFTILMITMVPIGYLLTSAVGAASNARQREAALQLADSWIEILSNSSVPTNSNTGLPATGNWLSAQSNPALTDPGGSQQPITTLANTVYSVEAYYSYQAVNNPTGQTDLCNGGQVGFTNPITIELQVKVTWDAGRQQLLDSTNFQQPLQAPTYGYLAVQLGNSQLLDASGFNKAVDRLQAVQVTITDKTTNTVLATPTPDTNGCVFVAIPTNAATNLSDPLSVSVGQPATNSLIGYTGIPPFVTTSGATTDTSGSVYPSGVQVTAGAKTVVDLDDFNQGVNDYDEAMTTSLAYGGASAVDGGVECPGTTQLPCLTTGSGPSTAGAAWGGSGSAWSSATLSGVNNLNQVACTSAASPTCVGVGEGSGAGVVLTTKTDLGTITMATVPPGPSGQQITDVTQVTCPSSDGCYALGTLANGNPVLLAGAVGQAPNAGAWQVVAAPASTTFDQLSSIACPTSTTCELTGSATVGNGLPQPEIFRLDGDPAGLAPTITTDSLSTQGNSPTVSEVGQITCPTSTECLALDIGDAHSPTEPGILVATNIAPTPTPPATPTASAWVNEPQFPTGAQSITAISCSSTNCVAIGTSGGAAAVWTGDLTQSPDAWAPATIPPGAILAATSVACGQPAGGDTANCVVAVAPQSGPGQLLDGSLTAGTWNWNLIGGPSDIQYYVGVACESPPSASQSTCAAVGATASGPVVTTSANGPAGPWSDQTPSSLSGAYVSGIPVATSAGSSGNWTNPVAAGQPNTTLGYLYPQPLGYSVAAADCAAEANAAPSATLSALAGGSASVTIPLGLIPLQVVGPTGSPVAGATITLTAATPSCPADTYTLPATDPSGLSQTSVPYGSYAYTITAGATSVTGTIQVNTNSVAIGGTTTYLPTPVEVTL